MKNKIIIRIFIAIIALGGGVLYYNQNHNLKDNKEKNISKQYDKTDEKEITLKLENDPDYTLPKLDNYTAAICQLKSIDGAINQNPATKEYSPIISSYGKLTIKKVLKGEINSREIDFLKNGGVITMSKYYNAMQPEQREKIKLAEKYDKDEMEKKFVEDAWFESTKKLESKKDFLCYLKYDKDYQKYQLVVIPEIFREVISYSDSNDFVLKNNGNENNDSFKNITDFEQKITNKSNN